MPLSLWIDLRFNVLCRVLDGRRDNGVVLCKSADIDLCAPITLGGGKLHHGSTNPLALEVGKIPAPCSMMGLHSLQRVDKLTATFHVERHASDQNDTVDCATRPKQMSHCAPRLGRVGAEDRISVLTNFECGSFAGDCKIDYCFWIHRDLELVCFIVVAECDPDTFRGERAMIVMLRRVIFERRRSPYIGRGIRGVKDTASKLSSILKSTVVDQYCASS